ncbi:hypothetical protein ACFQS7_15380 [Dankookia sp. GCM10030260]|uniref:hypothetical protein n=1 Tax=Dankookia sp. GCM10030260 TaxID=3273390 RepID=UPI00360761D6
MPRRPEPARLQRCLARALLALALLLGPLAGRQAAPAATIPVCTAEGGTRQLPDPLAPAVPAHVHCDACLVAPPALPVPAAGLAAPRSITLAWAAAAARHAAPAALPPEQARAPPAA